MKTAIAGMLLSIVSLTSAAKGPCSNEVCEKFYGAASYTLLSAQMRSIIIGEEARQKGSQEAAISHYVEGMKAVAKELKEQVQPTYQASLASAKGNKEIAASLKDMYAKWLGGINYFQKAVLESPRAKEAQYAIDNKAIETAWVKVQVEAGI